MTVFYEIDYDASPIPGVGKFVIKPEKLREPAKDPVRGLFGQMRDIAREGQIFGSTKFLDSRLSRNSAEIFYRQGMFMKDYSDNYPLTVPCSDRVPLYQQMGYEQLRTYFTWRTGVRMGEVAKTSEAYVFLYMYELLGNIGVDSPQDGLEKILFLWKEYSAYESHLNYYMTGWLKDYFIYYPLGKPFREFILEHGLAGSYNDVDQEDEEDFSKFLAVSKYNITKSAFFIGGRESLIMDCFCHVLHNLRLLFVENSMDFDESIYEPVGKMYEWKPFQGAVFYDWMKQEDRRVRLSKKTIYCRLKNKWYCGKVNVNENGRQLVGFIFKHMESVLRYVTGFKHKISANSSMLTHPAIMILKKKGISIEDTIDRLTREFYRESTKTVVEVDAASLLQIRREALEIQEKLIIEEENFSNLSDFVSIPKNEKVHYVGAASCRPQPTDMENDPGFEYNEKPMREVKVISDEPTGDADCVAAPEMAGDKHAFTEIEIKALTALLAGSSDIKQIAAEYGIMPEVLAGGINEKAMDLLGDCLLDTEFNLYEDYMDYIKELV